MSPRKNDPKRRGPGGARAACGTAESKLRGRGAADARAQSDALEAELRSVREELQGTIEELESSNEELKVSNEEVTSINEALQATNEELETSKEELQSLNEELRTVNNQLQAKIEELEAATNDLANLLGSTDIAVVFLDTQLRVRRSTPAISDLLQLTAADVGRPVVDIAQKFAGADIIATAKSVLDTLIPVEVEIHSHSGHWYVCRAMPHRTADDRIVGVVLTFIDVTQRRQAFDFVRESQARLQAALEQLPVAVLVAEAPSGRLVVGNHQAAVLFGHPYPLPVLDTEWSATHVAFRGFHASGRPYQRDDWPLARALASGASVVNEEIRFVRSDGSHGTMSASAAAIRDVGGTIVGAVATFWDISDQAEAEQRLRESEQRFRLVVEGAKQYAIVMLDADGSILTWNSGAQAIFGHTGAEAIGSNHSILYANEDKAQGAPERRLAMALGSPEGLPEEGWMVKKDGVAFWCSGTLTALRAENGAHRGFLKVVRDATDEQRHQAVLQQAKTNAELLRDAAEAANRAKDDFVATVSHELRTPLTAILLWARLLRDTRLDSQAVAEGVATIERAAAAQQQLVEDLLDVSRIASGKLRLSMRSTGLVAVLEASLDAVKPAAEARDVALEAEFSRDIGVVRADPNRIQQIVWNLLSNAVKFTPAGGKVKLSAWRQGNDVIIKVTDTGIGITRAFMPYLFDRFRQAHAGTTREHTGLGLGLAIARQLAELHGGTLSGESPGEGKGATFTARLPLVLVHGDGESAKPTMAAAVDLKGRNVLLVEDEEISRTAISACLRSAGADVVAVDSAKAALGVLEARTFDMIVTDIAMPGMDGYAMLSELRRREHRLGNSPTPAIALSAFARQEDQRRATEAGFHLYLIKPVESERLISTLSGMMGHGCRASP